MTQSTTKRIILLIFCLTPIVSKGQINLDSLVKTHKKVALLPVRVMYAFKKMPDGKTFKDIKQMEYEAGFLLQERFINQLYKDSLRVLIDIQAFSETNNLLAENEITIQDLKDLPADFICEALKVDAIIETEIRLTKNFTENERTAIQSLQIASMLMNPLNAGGTLLRRPSNTYSKATNRDDKTVTSMMTISDGKTGEIVKEYSLAMDGGVFNSSDKIITHALWTNFKKCPYYKK
jgi:hypothetical protein